MKFEVLFTPAEFAALPQCDLRATACVVFDVLRATSTFATALHHGAEAIIPVSEISQAIARRKKQPGVLLGGERHGVRISVDGVDFDLGNSPREYTPEIVRGKIVALTSLLAGNSIGQFGSYMPLDRTRQLELWGKLRGQHPETRAATDDELQAWREQREAFEKRRQ